MKVIIPLLVFLAFFGTSFGQSEEKKGSENKPESVEKAQEATKSANTEGGKEKSVSISSAARRSSMPANRGAAAERGSEAKEAGQGKGAETAEAARGAGASNSGRPTGNAPVVVPSARPLPPVVRPGRPNNPGNRPPGRPPGRPPVTPPGRPPGN